MTDEKNSWRSVRSFRASDDEMDEIQTLRHYLGLKSVGEVVRTLAREKLSVLKNRHQFFKQGGEGQLMLSERVALKISVTPGEK